MSDYDAIHFDMLAGIPNDYQKSQGFITYDITRAFAIAVGSLANDIDIAESKFFIDNLEGDDLARFVYEHRGIQRKEGTKAFATMELLSGGGHVSAGDLFSTETGETFEAVADYDLTVGDTWQVRSVGEGLRYNVAPNTIIKFPITIEGILEFTNPAAADGGSDTETDAALIERYKDDLLYPNNGSNKQAYINWAESVPGVGRVKIFSQPGGVANTVEICITDTEMTAPDPSIIEAVQNFIDPNENGDGGGIAPIGAKCTVTGADEKTINLSATLTLDGISLADAKLRIEEMLVEFFKESAFKRLGVDSYLNYISISQIGGKVLNIQGITDYSNLKLNGGTTSVTLADRETPVIGTVTVTI